MERSIFIWEKITEKEIRLLRAFGTDGVVMVPEWIDGRQVTEIGAYCFSRRKLPEGEWYVTRILSTSSESMADEKNWNRKKNAIWLSAAGETEQITDRMEDNFWKQTEQLSYLHELSEKYIQEVHLPASIRKVGACAFYNCSKMTALTIFPGTEEFGSDAFMNCLGLHRIHMQAHYKEKTGLKQLLAQVKWQVEVQFLEASVLYPEYYESYDEIGPAHIFELNLSGEGFRARQCFKDGVLQLASYDEIFPQACVEEKTEVLLQMAWNRLRDAWELTTEARSMYEAYIRSHGSVVTTLLLQEKRLEELHLFFKKGYGSEALIDEAVQLASGMAWTEATASLLGWKRELYAPKEQSVKSRYSFDTF